MKKIVKQTNLKIDYSMEKHYLGKKILYFDIETTGLSASRSMIYLIGILYQKDDGYESVQLFADNAIDEDKLIIEFADIVRNFDIIVGFNNDNFDLPFIKKRAKYLGLQPNILDFNITSFDMYKKMRSYCKVLGMKNAKQKTIEEYLGIVREDKFSGQELITYYRDYLISRDETMYDCLLLHNYEDVCGLAAMSDIITVCDFFDGKWNIICMKSVEEGILIKCELENCINKKLNFKNQYVEICANNKDLIFHLFYKHQELKYFYEDYKNYYYLPQEDLIVHKSVAEFVEKKYKTKATKEKCYVKKKSTFIKNYGLTNVHVFKEEYKDKDNYIEVKELLYLNNKQELKMFLKNIINSFIK